MSELASAFVTSVEVGTFEGWPEPSSKASVAEGVAVWILDGRMLMGVLRWHD